ncbi:MAG: ATP-binding protein [Gammaproteobacteria bacterium]|nr:ATP-binding protein [Gammaproteobacteria bacterium]
MAKRTLLSWSSGKDSAWALYQLQQNPEVEVVGLFTTINNAFERVAMHGVRLELLHQQAQAAGLPLHLIEIPNPCSHEEYAAAMQTFVNSARQDRIECFAFGDLFLEDVRQYREDRLTGTGITPIFPLWGIPTDRLAREMIAGGLKAVITCTDPRQLPEHFAGRFYDAELLASLPKGVDPCGEYGEFHSFAFAGPMFHYAIDLTVGETVQRDGFLFTDLLPSVV